MPDRRTPKRRFGDLGEKIAAEFLSRSGFLLIESNYWKPWGEIDLVCNKGGIIHFIEVKSVTCVTTKGGVSYETIRAEENMHLHKQKRLSRAILTYLEERAVSPETEYQVDLVTVRIDMARRVGRVELLEKIL